MAGFGLGIGDGGGLRGKLPAPQREMMREAIDIILKAWSAPVSIGMGKSGKARIGRSSPSR